MWPWALWTINSCFSGSRKQGNGGGGDDRGTTQHGGSSKKWLSGGRTDGRRKEVQGALRVYFLGGNK